MWIFQSRLYFAAIFATSSVIWWIRASICTQGSDSQDQKSGNMIEAEIRGIGLRILLANILQNMREKKAQERMQFKIVKKDWAQDHIKTNYQKRLFTKKTQNSMPKETNRLNMILIRQKKTQWIRQLTVKRRTSEIFGTEEHNKVLKANKTSKSWNL